MSFLPLLIRASLRSPSDQRGASPRASGPLDFADPRDNLYAFAKLWSTLGDQPVLSSFHGVMFAYIEGRRSEALFGYAGTGLFQSKILDNGHVRLRGKETGYFTDLVTGEVLQHWDNPYTGERVEVFTFLNDRIRGELTTEMPRFSFGSAEDAPTVMNSGGDSASSDHSSFVLPWEVFGDRVHLAWDYCHAYTNPVDKARWPKASTHDMINPSEHFYFTTSLAELEHRSRPSARYTAGFSRISPWWPWMRMGESQVSGALFGRMISVKADGRPEDVPRRIYAHTEKHHPEYLEAPDDWDDGKPIGTWEAYARDVPPESS